MLFSKYDEPENSDAIVTPIFSSDEFEYYNTSLHFRNGIYHEMFNYYGEETMKQVSRLNLEAELESFDTDGFVLQTKGSADIIAISSYYPVEEDSKLFENARLVYMPVASRISIRHPKLPLVLEARYYPHGETIQTFDDISFSDFEAFESYDDFCQFALVSDYYAAEKANVMIKFFPL